MSTETPEEITDAPERYELENEPFPRALPIHADLFQLFGDGLVVLSAPDPDSQIFDVWLHIGGTGQITVCAGKAEVGQNARTSLAQAVADELPVPFDAIRVILGDTDLTPFDIGTFGSRTTPLLVPLVRRAAATARECLIALAPPGLTPDYGSLVQGRRVVLIAGPDVPVTPADHWRLGGTSVPKIGGRAFVTGEHHFTSDLAVEGMLYGKVLRPPTLHSVLRQLDLRGARDLPGVTIVHEGSFVGVVAGTVSDAERALAAITAEWEVPASSGAQDLVSLFRPEPTSSTIPLAAGTGHALSATYTLAYIAHVPLEPRAALAMWDSEGKLTVWTGTQRPFGVREELVAAFGLPEGSVRVIVPDTGSGYGGKHTGEAALEAARLSLAVSRPVKLVWAREEEFTAAYLRPAGVIDVCAATTEDGKITEWEQHNYNSGGAGLRTPYAIPDPRAEFHEVPSPLRQGSYRALAATGNHFARESHMDDLARAHGMDPLAFRLHNLTDDRLCAVLRAAAERFGWEGRSSAPGHGFGIAGGAEKGSFLANCVEVVVAPESGKVTIVRIVAAYECGAIINPLHLQNQVEGATVMGLGGALFEAIRFDGGRILNPRLSEYRVPRFGDVPEIEVVLLDRKDLPSVGAGETPIVAIAPAIGNAIFDATGIRLRSLPLVPDGLRF